MFDLRELKGKIREHTALAQSATDSTAKEHALRMARSYLLMAKNAEWLGSTDEFLSAIKHNKPWPHPKGFGSTN